MESTANEVADLLGLLSNRNRLMILCQLAEGEKSVGELARLLKVRETAVSQQLAILRRERIVEPRREAQMVHYRLVRGDVGKLIMFLYETYCSPGAAATTKGKKT
ncbi:MAG: metalloregulator ArsR/SmtB family transcription factor [Pseudomonadota bacterium]